VVLCIGLGIANQDRKKYAALKEEKGNPFINVVIEKQNNRNSTNKKC
jgi:hypothetical protein